MTDRATERLNIQLPEGLTERDQIDALANEQIRQFAVDLISSGKRPLFEVWYPQTTQDTFDVLELVDGQFVTAPPYVGRA